MGGAGVSVEGCLEQFSRTPTGEGVLITRRASDAGSTPATVHNSTRVES